MRRVFLHTLIILSAAGLFIPWASNAQERRLCFDVPGITSCIEGRFREYWEQNGGLAVFGYPISPAARQQTAEGNFLTQYFERNRFELHPEKARPYDVLLGRLGDDRLKQQGRDWFAFPEGQQTAGCLWFAETSHSVCDQEAGIGFKSYWESHGLEDPTLTRFARSLALFGLPLSEPALETNAAGATVMTQWFERARLEWHPEKPRQFKVLLGLLGNETRGSPTLPPPATAQPTPSPSPTAAPDPCADAPAPVNATVRPSNCVREGTIVTIEVSGFAPDEQVGFWLTAPDGSMAGSKGTYNIGPTGGIEFDWDTADATPGLWYWVFQATESGHEAVAYVKILQR